MGLQAQGSIATNVGKSTVNTENLSVEPEQTATPVASQVAAEITKDGRKDQVVREGQASNEQIRQAVKKINDNAQNSEVVFGIHDATNRVTIKIIDKESKKVVKEFPPEKTLDMIAKVWEMAGIMVDEKR